MTRKFFVIANPVAGRKKAGKLLEELTRFLLERDHTVTYEVHETSPGQKGDTIVRQRLDGSFTDLVIIGGDGTIHEAINGLSHDIPVSIIPAGSGNDYVKTLHIGQSIAEQLETVLSGQPSRVDLGACNDRRFVNGVGVGFDGQIVADMLHRRSWLSGQAKYYAHVLRILSGYQSREYRMTVDGKFHHKMMILMTLAKGTTFGGGFRLTPHAQLDDGKLAVCEIATIPGWKRYANILRLQNGSHDVLKEVHLYKAQNIQIETNDWLEGHIDGEYLGKPPFDIRVLPGALQIRQNKGQGVLT